MRALITFALLLALAGGCVIQSDPQAEQNLALQVPGRYVAESNGETAEMILAPDGTGSLNGQPGRWEIQLGTLMLSDGQQWVPASLVGGTLTVQTPEGAVAFQRQDAGGVAAGAPGGVAAQADPSQAGGDPAIAGDAPAPAGAIDARLVGCWEDFASSGGSSGSGMSQTTLQLGADGSYSRRVYSSFSAGGTSMEDDKREAGVWRAGDATLSLSPHQGEPSRYDAKLEGGILYLGGIKHLPCD